MSHRHVSQPRNSRRGDESSRALSGQAAGAAAASLVPLARLVAAFGSSSCGGDPQSGCWFFGQQTAQNVLEKPKRKEKKKSAPLLGACLLRRTLLLQLVVHGLALGDGSASLARVSLQVLRPRGHLEHPPP